MLCVCMCATLPWTATSKENQTEAQHVGELQIFDVVALPGLHCDHGDFVRVVHQLHGSNVDGTSPSDVSRQGGIPAVHGRVFLDHGRHHVLRHHVWKQSHSQLSLAFWRHLNPSPHGRVGAAIK